MTNQTAHPEAITVALELTKMIVEKNTARDTTASRELADNPEGFILNVFERCLHVTNGGHARTTYSEQDNDS